jgi:hypothetical protein
MSMTRDRSDSSGVIMSSRRPFTTVAIVWPVVVLAGLVVRVLMTEHSLTTLEYAAWIFFALMPPAIAWVMKRNQPDPSMSQVIYDAEQRPSSRPPAGPRG